MKEILERIEKQINILQEKYKDDFFEYQLNDGATDEDFERLEEVLGYALPEDFKEIYRIHNGEKEGYCLMGEEWLSIDRIIDEYKIWKELYDDDDFSEDGKDYGCSPEEGIKPDFWWNPKWISLTADGGGNGKMIDLDPAPGGTAGQIIQMWHDDPIRSKKTDSLYGFFRGTHRIWKAENMC